ncbi:unnamed protein product [Amaranthus hypochondriacus]
MGKTNHDDDDHDYDDHDDDHDYDDHDDDDVKKAKWVCVICDKSFSTAQGLGGHMGHHSGKKNSSNNQTLNETRIIVSGSNTGQSGRRIVNAPPMGEVVRIEDIYYDEIIKKIREITKGLEKYDDDEIYYLQDELGLTIPPFKPCFLTMERKLNLDDENLKQALNMS